ncbi:MAG: hypothetical protein Q4D91_05645 [Lautropia sp.]|nr:hypothetical protein [Lautropia sp.]
MNEPGHNPRLTRPLWIVLPWLLSACAALSTSPPAPAHLPDMPALQQFIAHPCDERAAPLGPYRRVIVQRLSANQSRWLMLDALGAPEARQITEHGQWRQDGFLPPNPDATQLFASMLAAMTPVKRLHEVYPALTRHQQGDTLHDSEAGQMRWQIRQSGSGWQIRLPAKGNLWCIKPIGEPTQRGNP